MLQMNYLEEISNFGELRLTSGKVEGTVRKSKLVRVLGFGYPEDYFSKDYRCDT